MNIYVHKDGTQYGPYTLEQLQQYIQQGSFTLQDQACYDGQNWVTIAQVPGIASSVANQSQAATQPQAQTATPQQATGKRKTVSAQTKQAAQTSDQSSQQVSQDSGKGGTKILLLVGGLVILLIGLSAGLWIYLSEDKKTDEKEKIVADGADREEEGKEEESTTNESEKENVGPISPSSTGKSIPLIDRIPSDTGAVILVGVNDLLDKGRDDISALLPPGLPPMVSKALEDPSSLGLDVSEPIQIHLIANENTDVETGGLAGKLSDSGKFMTTLELLAGLEAPEQKDGYYLYQPLGGADGSEAQIAIGSDFFFVGGANNPSDREPSIDKFMTADGSDSLVKSSKSFALFFDESHDLSIWFGGDSILETIGSQLDNADLDSMKGGSGTISLNFEEGQLIAQLKVDVPNNEMVYGKGGFSDVILKFTPTDSILALGFAFDVSKFVEFAEKEILPEFGDDIKLNEPMPELGGLSIKDVISSFTGEFMISLTDVKMPQPGAGGALPGGPPMDVQPGNNPFGDPEMEEGNNPFPVPGGSGGFPGGGPPGGMDPSAMMMASMPKPEFIVSASIDTEKWLKFKAAPPVAMGMGLAMMQGYAITEKDNFLLIASKDHIEATQSGSVKNPVSGSGKELFADNDFVLKINVAPILKMDLPIPPGGPTEILKEISHLEMSSNSAKTSGTGTMKLAFTDKRVNSLSKILEMAQAALRMGPMGVVDDLDAMDEEFEFE